MKIKNQCEDTLSQIPVTILIFKMFWRLLTVSTQRFLLVERGVERWVLICTKTIICVVKDQKSHRLMNTHWPLMMLRKNIEKKKKWLIVLEYQKQGLSIKDWHLLLFTSSGTRVYTTVMGVRGLQCLLHAPSVFALDPFQPAGLGGKGLVTCTGARHHRVTNMFWLHFQRYLMLFICMIGQWTKHCAQASVVFASWLVKTCKMCLVVPLQHTGSRHTPYESCPLVTVHKKLDRSDFTSEIIHHPSRQLLTESIFFPIIIFLLASKPGSDCCKMPLEVLKED